MKSLIKCPNCNKNFEIYDILLSKKYKNIIHCNSCKKEFIPENILYRRVYEFFVVPLITISINQDIEGGIVYVTILITFIILGLLFDLIPHRFNKYIESIKR